MEHSHEEICAILNEQTGQLSWPELEKHFARGVVLKVAAELDLIKVAASLVSDDKQAMSQWTESLQVDHANEKDAKDWHQRQPFFWAVVVAPWVLIQEKR